MFGKAKQFLFDEDRGVSPVIGVILMVAITVILAAVIATFVMNMGPSEQTQPSVQWEWNVNSHDNVTLSHTGGDAAPATQFVIEDNDSDSATLDQFPSVKSEELTAGSTVHINDTHGPLNDDPINNSFTLIWENPSNDQTQVIDEYEP